MSEYPYALFPQAYLPIGGVLLLIALGTMVRVITKEKRSHMMSLLMALSMIVALLGALCFPYENPIVKYFVSCLTPFILVMIIHRNIAILESYKSLAPETITPRLITIIRVTFLIGGTIASLLFALTSLSPSIAFYSEIFSALFGFLCIVCDQSLSIFLIRLVFTKKSKKVINSKAMIKAVQRTTTLSLIINGIDWLVLILYYIDSFMLGEGVSIFPIICDLISTHTILLTFIFGELKNLTFIGTTASTASKKNKSRSRIVPAILSWTGTRNKSNKDITGGGGGGGVVANQDAGGSPPASPISPPSPAEEEEEEEDILPMAPTALSPTTTTDPQPKRPF